MAELWASPLASHSPAKPHGRGTLVFRPEIRSAGGRGAFLIAFLFSGFPWPSGAMAAIVFLIVDARGQKEPVFRVSKKGAQEFLGLPASPQLKGAAVIST